MKKTLHLCSELHGIGRKTSLMLIFKHTTMPKDKLSREIVVKGWRKTVNNDFLDIAPGGSDDWAYDQGIKYSFTFELQDRGQYGFLLPPNLITSACNEAFAAVKTIVLRVLEKLQ